MVIKKDFDYSDQYVTPEGDDTQYSAIDLRKEPIVRARYVKSKIQFDNGNPFIEALPHPREGEDAIFNAYNRDIVEVSEEDKAAMKPYEKLSSILLLRKLRLQLPFHQSLEYAFYNTLIMSYRDRHLMDMSIDLDDETAAPELSLQGDEATATNSGFSLLGYSGCGKSSALEILLQNYPQVIIHNFGKFRRFTQIVYIVVTCPQNSNFSELWKSFGRAVDRALGYDTPRYEELIASARGLGAKANIVWKMIERFGIGIVIFDEIQLIDLVSTKENSIESLLYLANVTKVGMGVVGTEDAFEKLFKKQRTGRRFGNQILGNEYCRDRQYFDWIVDMVFQTQFFDYYITPDKELKDALYDDTKGIIDMLIGIYIFMQFDYVLAPDDDKPKVNAKYVHDTVQRHYPGLSKLLSNLDDPAVEAQRIELLKNGNEEIETIVAKQKEEQRTRAIGIMNYMSSEQAKEKQTRASVIIQGIMGFTDEFSVDEVREAVRRTLAVKANKNNSDSEIRKKAYQFLLDKKAKTEKEASADIAQALRDDMLMDIAGDDKHADAV